MTPEKATIAVLHDAILRLKAELATARREAYEDAAKECDRLAEPYEGMPAYKGHYNVLKQAALAIRSQGETG